jgi:hypothetical protein
MKLKEIINKSVRVPKDDAEILFYSHGFLARNIRFTNWPDWVSLLSVHTSAGPEPGCSAELDSALFPIDQLM